MHLPKPCQLMYDDRTQPQLLELIDQVPSTLWGARLALKVCSVLPTGLFSAATAVCFDALDVHNSCSHLTLIA